MGTETLQRELIHSKAAGISQGPTHWLSCNHEAIAAPATPMHLLQADYDPSGCA